MKLTKETLKRIIKEELEAVMDEGLFDGMKSIGSHKQSVGAYGSDTADDMERRRKEKVAARGKARRDQESMLADMSAALESRMSEYHKKVMEEVEESYDGRKLKRFIQQGMVNTDYISDIRYYVMKHSKYNLQKLENITADQINSREDRLTKEEIAGNVSSAATKALQAMEKVPSQKELKQQIEKEMAPAEQPKSRSFMQKAGSFLSGKGFKEE